MLNAFPCVHTGPSNYSTLLKLPHLAVCHYCLWKPQVLPMRQNRQGETKPHLRNQPLIVPVLGGYRCGCAGTQRSPLAATSHPDRDHDVGGIMESAVTGRWLCSVIDEGRTQTYYHGCSATRLSPVSLLDMSFIHNRHRIAFKSFDFITFDGILDTSFELQGHRYH